MESGQARKAFKFGIVSSIFLLMTLLLFQNCQNGGVMVEGQTSSTNQPSTGGNQNGSGTTSTNPGSSNGGYTYTAIRMDQVCTDANADKKAIIGLYVRLFRRCADRPGLDHWYNMKIRNNLSLGAIEQSFRSSQEYLNRNTPALNTSARFCLTGDNYEILADNQLLSVLQIDGLSPSDTRTFSARCKTNYSANPTKAAAFIVRDIVSTGLDSAGGFVCAISGDSLRNQIIELYLTYLDRCPENEGLEWWARNWAGDSSFLNSTDVQNYLKCRFVNGDRAQGVQNSIDTCYRQLSNTVLCPTGIPFVPPRYCEKTGA